MPPKGAEKNACEWQGDAFRLEMPSACAAPLVLASPHSGRSYPRAFLAQSRLDPLALRKSEDAYMDLLLAEAPGLGLPVLSALFPRAFCDANREPYELDPHMFSEALPAHANTRSVRVACGLGTIARVVSDGHEIYRGKLRFKQAEDRISLCYRPYHDALARVLSSTKQQFGRVLLLDFHSMPSVGGPMDRDVGHGRADIVLGDRYGTAADPALMDQAERLLRARGFRVARNVPYAGGHTTLLHGRPSRQSHTIQVEINRALYLDERLIEPSSRFETLKTQLTGFLADLAEEMGGLSAKLAAE